MHTRMQDKYFQPLGQIRWCPDSDLLPPPQTRKRRPLIPSRMGGAGGSATAPRWVVRGDGCAITRPFADSTRHNKASHLEGHQELKLSCSLWIYMFTSTH